MSTETNTTATTKKSKKDKTTTSDDSSTLSVRLDKTTADELARVANLDDRSVSYVMLHAIKLGLPKLKANFQARKAAETSESSEG